MSTIASSLSSKTRSINSIPIEYNVKMEHTTCSSLCNGNLFISCMLFLGDICVEYFIVLQWINYEYYVAVITFFSFIFISNVSNLIQWYFSFKDCSTFKLYHLIIPFGLIGLLPIFSVIYYLSHASVCICARMRICNKNNISNENSMDSSDDMQQRKKLVVRSKSYVNNDVSELLLPERSSASSIDHIPPKIDIYQELSSNITQLLVMQAFIRMVPFICIALFVLIAITLDPTNWLKDIDIPIHIPHQLDSLLIEKNDISDYYFIGIFLTLLTYAFITVTYLDQYPLYTVQCLQILFIIGDCIIRTMPIIVALYCDEIHTIYTIIALEMLWCLEVCFWYEIYEYYPEFPMRKIYPLTYNEIFDSLSIDVSSPPSHIPLQSQHNITTDTASRISFDSDSQQKYENPQYISNAIVLSPKSVDSYVYQANNDTMKSNIIRWSPQSILKPISYGLVYEEYIAFCQGILGGTLSCVSGWLIGRSIRHCIESKQYKTCIIELVIRYIFSIVLMVIYCIQYKVFKYKIMDSKYWIWPLFVGCLLCVVPYIVVVHWLFKPKQRRQKLSPIVHHNRS